MHVLSLLKFLLLCAYIGQHMNLETIFVLDKYELYKSKDKSYRLVSERYIKIRILLRNSDRNTSAYSLW